MSLNRKNLYCLLKEAIQTIDPVRGVTMTDILKYAKYKGNWDKEKLKSAITKIIKSNLGDHKLKKVGYRYKMNVILHDENSKLCGTCGAKTAIRKRSSKKGIKVVICKTKRKKGKKRKSKRKHKCGKSRRRKHKSRRKRKSKCKKKRSRRRKRKSKCKKKRSRRRRSKGKCKKRKLSGTACILSCLRKNKLMKRKRKRSRSKSKCKSRPAEHENKLRQKPEERIPEQQQN